MKDWRKHILHTKLTRTKVGFLEAFGNIYEHSSWVAERAWYDLDDATPISYGQLASIMRQIVNDASEKKQIALLKAHPQLAGKAALAGQLTHSSALEQRGAGLDQCSYEELTTLQRLNDQYVKRFGFPFIIAVGGLNRSEIIESLKSRCNSAFKIERREAMVQVYKIAEIRLLAIAKNERK